MQFRAAYCVVFLAGALSAAQPPAPDAGAGSTTTPGAQSTSPGANGAATPVKDIMQPAVMQVGKSVTAIHFDRWKKGDIRDEASNDVSSIGKDLQSTLPPLVEAADAEPGSVAKLMPAFQNVDAVYDVLLRVYSASRVAGQADDVSRLQQALSALGDARRALADRMVSQSEAHAKQIAQLQASNQSLQTKLNAPAPQPQPCVPPPPVKHARKRAAGTAQKDGKPAAAQKPAAGQKPGAAQPAQKPATTPPKPNQ